jgi:hypothetical protein
MTSAIAITGNKKYNGLVREPCWFPRKSCSFSAFSLQNCCFYKGDNMPEIARFYGMVIKMFFSNKENQPPHIHVNYGDYAGLIDIRTGEMIEGDLPARSYHLVKEWYEAHKSELLDMWNNQRLQKLPPLE